MAAGEQDPEERSGIEQVKGRSQDPAVQATARKIRRVGFPILFGLILWLTIPILYGVIRGNTLGEVNDPFSKRALGVDDPGHDCERWGLELLQTPHAEQLARWAPLCAERAPRLAALLQGSAGIKTR